MAPITIKYIVSFSSQDKVHKASNLLDGGEGKKWLGDPADRSGQLEAIFQLEKRCTISFVDIGMIWASNVEVRVGKSDWPQTKQYVILVPSQTLMTAQDAMLRRNTTRTCMFGKANFLEEGGKGEWDRVQIVCRQLWKKEVQIGLSFLRLSCVDKKMADIVTVSPASTETEKNVPGGIKPLGLKNTVADIQEHFFGKQKKQSEENGLKQKLLKVSATAEGGTTNPEALPRMARMVLEANKNGRPTPPPMNGYKDNNGLRLFSNALRQQQSPEFPIEVADFLHSLKLTKEDIFTLKVSDLRHKFEKQIWRKLSQDEKHMFFTVSQDFFGILLDEDEAATAAASAVSKESKSSAVTPNHQKNSASASGSALNGDKTSEKSTAKSSASATNNQKNITSTSGCKNGVVNVAKTSAQTPNNQKNVTQSSVGKNNSENNSELKRKMTEKMAASSANTSASTPNCPKKFASNGSGGKNGAPSSCEKIPDSSNSNVKSGAAVKSSKITLPLLNKPSVSKFPHDVGKSPNGVNTSPHNVKSPTGVNKSPHGGKGEYMYCGISGLSMSKSKVSGSGQNTTTTSKPQTSRSTNLLGVGTNRASSDLTESGGFLKNSALQNGLQKSPKPSSASSAYLQHLAKKSSSIDSSLLNTHKQFVSGRAKNLSSPTAVRTSTAVSKRPISPSSSSDEDRTPAKRRLPDIEDYSSPESSATPKDGWLSARRGGGSQGQSEGQGQGRAQGQSRGRGRGRGRGQGKTEGQSSGRGGRGRGETEGQGRGRGRQGRGAAKGREREEEEEGEDPMRLVSVTTSGQGRGRARGGRSRGRTRGAHCSSLAPPTSPSSSTPLATPTPPSKQSKRPKSKISTSRSKKYGLTDDTDSESEKLSSDSSSLDDGADPFDLVPRFAGNRGREADVNSNSDPYRNELEILDDEVFVECPLCGEMFPSDTVNIHASGCQGNDRDSHHRGNGQNSGYSRNEVRESGGGGGGSRRGGGGGGGRGGVADDAFVQCPLCDDMFPSEIITEHASTCSL